jgi:hypothetical protein
MKYQMNLSGQTAIFVASKRNLIKMAYLLIMLRIPMNEDDMAQRKCLYYAIKLGYHKMVVILIANFTRCFWLTKNRDGGRIFTTYDTDDPLMRAILSKGRQY